MDFHIWRLLEESGRKESWAPICWPKILVKLHTSHVGNCYNRSRQVPCDNSKSVYLLYGNVRPKGCLKKEVVIMLKNLIFLFCFVLFCFACLFFCLFGGGERMLLRRNGGSISRYQLSIKGELQRIDSQWEGIFRILWSLMEDQGIFVVTQPKSSHTSPLPSPPPPSQSYKYRPV